MFPLPGASDLASYAGTDPGVVDGVAGQPPTMIFTAS